MTEGRPNFYELLGLDPSVDDWPAIQKALERSKQVWNLTRSQKTGQKKQEAEAKLAWVDEARRVLVEPTLRRREALARRQALEAARQADFQELDRRIGILSTLGTCSPEQFDKLVGQFAGRISKEDIVARLRQAELAVGDAATGPATGEPKEFLADGELAEIQHALSMIDVHDLYSFLDLGAEVDATQVIARATELNKASVGKTDARSTAILKLTGIAMGLFDKPQGKQRYDASLATSALRQLHTDLELMIADGTLGAEAIEMLLATAASHCVDPVLARAYFDWYCRQRGWKMAPPAKAKVPPRSAQPPSAPSRPTPPVEPSRPAPPSAPPTQANPPATPPSTSSRPPIVTPSSEAARVALQAPKSLAVEVLPNGFRLYWPRVSGSRITYWVVRKQGGFPEDEGDGDLRKEVQSPPFDDEQVPPGNWCYAVFALRDGETSNDAALSGPHTLRKRQVVTPARAFAAAAAALAVTFMIWRGVANPVAPPAVSTPAQPSPVVNPPPVPNLNSTPDPNAQQDPATQIATQLPAQPPQKTQMTVTHASASSPLGNSLRPSVSRPESPTVPSSPAPRALPAKPRIAVLTQGSRALDPLVAKHLIDELRQRGFETVGRSSLMHLDDHLAAGGPPNARALMPVLAQDEVDVLIYAEITHLGDQTRKYLGRESTTSQMALGVQAYLVGERKAVGSESTETFEYTSINPAKGLPEIAHALGGKLKSAVERGWTDLRKREGLTP